MTASWLLVAALVTPPPTVSAQPRGQYDSTDVWLSAAAGGVVGSVVGWMVGGRLGADRETGDGFSAVLGSFFGAAIGNFVGAPLGVAGYEAVSGQDGSLVAATAGSFSGLFVGLLLGAALCAAGEGGCLVGAGVLLLAPATGAATGYDSGDRRPRATGALLSTDGERIELGVPVITTTSYAGETRYTLTLAAGRF